MVEVKRQNSFSLFVPLAASRALVHGDRTVGEVGVKQLFNSNSLWKQWPNHLQAHLLDLMTLVFISKRQGKYVMRELILHYGNESKAASSRFEPFEDRLTEEWKLGFLESSFRTRETTRTLLRYMSYISFRPWLLCVPYVLSLSFFWHTEH